MNMTELVSAENAFRQQEQEKAQTNPNSDASGRKSKEQWREERMSEMQEIWSLMDQQTAKVFLSAGSLESHLRTQARLGELSASNVILVEGQMPSATDLRTFDEWKKMDASILSGSKAIRVLSPVQITKDGEERTYFNIKKVFDISQTSLKDEANISAHNAVGANDIQALLRSAPVKAEVNDKLPEQFNARYNSAKNVIEMRSDFGQNAVAELARPIITAHRKEHGKESDSHVAAMAATILAYRIDPNAQTSKENLALCISHLTPNEPQVLRASLTEAKRDAREVYSLYRDALKEIRLEKAKDKAMER